MTSPELEMSLEQIPVLIEKTQMNGDRGGSQCGLTSLLPMSCRGRAAAFARDLHSRLRNLGAAQDDEEHWLPNHKPASSTQRDHDTFYDFELECESPSSPVDEFEHAFTERSPTEEKELPFYDVESEPAKEKLHLQSPDKTKNGLRFSTAFYSDCSPVKLQPVARENGHADKPLYSAMTFEGCARQNSWDEIDCAPRATAPTAPAAAAPTAPAATADHERLRPPLHLSSTVDSDSEFESAKSDPSDGVDEVFQNGLLDEVNDLTEVAENLSITENETVEKEDKITKEETIEEVTEEVIDIETVEQEITETKENGSNGLEIITSEVPSDKESSPVPDIEPSLLSAEVKEEEPVEGEDDRPQRVRRCSSLKTGKTPPGTPGRKKIVRFADVLGLDLADVKTFMDEIPVIPKSAYDDLTGCDVASSPPARAAPRLGALTLVPLFQLPRDFTDNLEARNVCLESARVCDGVHVTVCGSVRVRNLDFHKTVLVRYTMNRWRTYTDLTANYVQGSCDGYSDRFQFVLYAPAISSGQRLELAVRFLCKGQQFWDNNCGANYCFDCLALGAASPGAAGPLHPTLDWHPSFY